MRILHGPTTIGNQSWYISRAERNLGHDSHHVVNYDTWVKFPSDRILSGLQTQDQAEIRTRTEFAMTSPFDYDVFHYNFGRSFMVFDDLPLHNHAPFADLKLAKSLGKTVFMTLQGCDARIAHQSNQINDFTPCAEGRCGAYATCVASLDAQRKELIETILPLCDKVFYLNPELGHFVPNAEFLPYAAIDPFDFEPVAPVERETLKVLHAPSDPSTKGSDLILPALEAIKDEFNLEIVLVKGKSHAEAMELYRDCDVAIDQVLYGWYGGFAVEMMAMGKPVMCAIRESDLEFVPEAFLNELPILRIDPAYLIEDFRNHFSDRAKLRDAGIQSRKFAEKWHDPAKIANAMVDTYENPSAPFNWNKFQTAQDT